MKKSEYSKDKLISIIIEGQKDTTRYMGKISQTLQSLNDSNVLHKKAIDLNTVATKEMSSGVNSLLSMFKWVVVTLVVAIIVLAGAERALQFIPFIR